MVPSKALSDQVEIKHINVLFWKQLIFFISGFSEQVWLANFLLQKQLSLKIVGIRNFHIIDQISRLPYVQCTWYIFKWRVTWNKDESCFKQDITMLKAYIKASFFRPSTFFVFTKLNWIQEIYNNWLEKGLVGIRYCC